MIISIYLVSLADCLEKFDSLTKVRKISGAVRL